MQTLHNHTLIYDAECPLCDFYTQGFIDTGMLDAKDGRIPFDANIATHYPQLDVQRACNEIALVNTANGEVLYGVDSLSFVIGNTFPLIRTLMTYGWLRCLMTKFYSFISYNRKVIVPGTVFESSNACAPSFNLTYRWLYILLAWLATAMILTSYSQFFMPFIPSSTFAREYIICGGQILFQSLVVSFIRRDRLIHYLGNMMTISLGGALLLLTFILVKLFAPELPWYAAVLWFFGVVGLMLLEHVRRLKILDIHWSASLGWVVYRVLVLILLITLIY